MSGNLHGSRSTRLLAVAVLIALSVSTLAVVSPRRAGAAGSIDLTGTWNSSDPNGIGAAGLEVIVQDAAGNLTGSFLGLVLTGNISGNAVTIYLTGGAYVATDLGTVAADGNSMGGTWSDTSGNASIWKATRASGDTLTASVTSGMPANGLLPVTLTLANTSTGTVSGLTYPSVPGLVVVPDPVATGGSMTLVGGPTPALPTSIPPQTTVTVTYQYSVDVLGAIELGTEVHGTDSVSGAQDAPAAGVFSITENPTYGQTGAAVGDNLTNGLSQVAAQGGQVYRTSIDWIGANHASLPGATPGQTQPSPYQLEMAATMGLPPSAAWVIPDDPLQAKTVLQGLRSGIEQGHIDAGTSMGQGLYNLGQAVLAGPTGWKSIAQGVGQSIANGTAALNGAITAGLTPFANFAYASTADKGAMLAAFPNAVPSQVATVSTALQGQLAALATQYANDPAGFAYAWARATTANVDTTVAAAALTAAGQEGVVAAAGPTVTKAVAAVNAFGEPYMATLSSSAGQFASALTNVPTAIAGTAAPLDGAVADAVNQGVARYGGSPGVTPTAGWQARLAAVTSDAAAGFTNAQIAELQVGGITVYEGNAIQQVAAQEQAIMKARGYDVTYGIGIAEATPESEAVYQQALIDHALDPSIPLPRAKGEAFKDMKSLMSDDLLLGAPQQYMGLGAIYKPTIPAQSVLDTADAANPGSSARILKRFFQMDGAYNAAFNDATYLGKNISLSTQPGGYSFTFPGTFPRSETWDLKMSVANGLDGKPLLDPATGRPLAFTLLDKTTGAPMIADLDISATFNVATGQQLPVGEKAASFLRVRQGLQKLGVRTADHGWYGFDLSTQDLVGTKAMFRSRLERTNPANVSGYSQQLANAYNKLAAAAGKPAITAGDLLVGAKLARLTVTFTAKTVTKGFIA